MLKGYEKLSHDRLRNVIRHEQWIDESQCLAQRLKQARLETSREKKIQEKATRLATSARRIIKQQPGLEAFMQEYDLSSREGVILMCLAEALLRIPDAATADRLITDRLSRGHWDRHLGQSNSLLVNASSWGLLLTGRLLEADGASPEQALKRLVARAGEPIVRAAMRQAMQLMAHQFVLGRDIREALERSNDAGPHIRYSYDCLGEAAHTADDVERYFNAYQTAIRESATANQGGADVFASPGISIKLSALHPRYEYAQRVRVFNELIPRLVQLIRLAADVGIGVTLDGEEADRLDLSLDIFAQVSAEFAHGNWQGLGLAVQAYQKRALPLLQWLKVLAERERRRIPVRLVKGAYWDSEIKRAQERGLSAYPVFTRKAATDVSYLACARFMLQNHEQFYAQFASHNAFTLAWVMDLAEGRAFELQRLHGMGDALFNSLSEVCSEPPPIRVYAPVGSHEALLPYLVRRLLENGANSSFVNQLSDTDVSIESLVENPCQYIESVACSPHPHIPLPADIYAKTRTNSHGWDLSDADTVEALGKGLQEEFEGEFIATAIIEGRQTDGQARTVRNPANRDERVGIVHEPGPEQVLQALSSASQACFLWDEQGGAYRADCLRRAADLFESNAEVLMALIIREGGRTLPDAIAELREAVDFCRYYAWRADEEFENPLILPGPTGERNELRFHGRGVFACISPWNFPLAIFVGQVTAALAAGNAVLAKPARQTPLTAHYAVRLMHEAGIPQEILHFIPGSGNAIGAVLFSDRRLSGIAFTGSTETAWVIQRALASRKSALVPLIAETGGQNVMIADSSALPEQLVVDVVQSAFNSAGQRCSALRVLFIQEELADAFLALLQGAMEELCLGDPAHPATDIGPLIDPRAAAGLEAHVERMTRDARLVYKVPVSSVLQKGAFFPPQVYELGSLKLLDKEVFGPILHVIRYRGDHLDRVIDAINSTGYGLTLGVHSRIEATWQCVSRRARVGNLYINRNMIGAVVGAQPFGGEGLSGTGPKAGGPYYLHRFATERTRSVNIAAMGGDAGLLSLNEH